MTNIGEDKDESTMDAEGVPSPPWRLAPRAAPRVPLTREAIVEAALRVLDAEGMDKLSMRRVGEELEARRRARSPWSRERLSAAV